MQNPRDEVYIGLVGKYVEYEDSYKSLKEALLHGGLAHDAKVNINWIESEQLEVAGCERGAGTIRRHSGSRRIRQARHRRHDERHPLRARSKVPYFGICLGMQTMVIEFARNVCGLAHANSTEFDPATPDRVIYKLRELKGVDELGGTMRLGAYPCLLAEGSFARAGLRQPRDQRAPPPSLRIQSRIRSSSDSSTACGSPAKLPTASTSRSARLPDHPWYLGCQFHPEFKSKPLEPHPLFRAFIGAALEHRARSRISRAGSAAAARTQYASRAD